MFDFIDLNKCFDSIYRNALWYKLHKADIRGKLLHVICNMYSCVKSCVKHCNKFFTIFFNMLLDLDKGKLFHPFWCLYF